MATYTDDEIRNASKLMFTNELLSYIVQGINQGGSPIDPETQQKVEWNEWVSKTFVKFVQLHRENDK